MNYNYYVIIDRVSGRQASNLFPSESDATALRTFKSFLGDKRNGLAPIETSLYRIGEFSDGDNFGFVANKEFICYGDGVDKAYRAIFKSRTGDDLPLDTAEVHAEVNEGDFHREMINGR